MTDMGSASADLPTDNSCQSGTADDTKYSGGQAKQPAKPKAGVDNTILTAPIKGPRSGIHWGAGVQFCLFAIVCAPSSTTPSHVGVSTLL